MNESDITLPRNDELPNVYVDYRSNQVRVGGAPRQGNNATNLESDVIM